MELITKKELAALLKCTTRTVEHRMALGMPHLKMSQRCVRFKRSDVEAWLDQKFSTCRFGKLVTHAGSRCTAVGPVVATK